MGKPLISVCIPIFNGAHHLDDCLKSVITQQGINFEIIISDDNSTDGSYEIVQFYRKEYPEISWTLLHNVERLGMAGNWNVCVQASQGKYVKVIGQDDLLYPNALAIQVDMMEKHPDAALVFTACDIISSSGKKIFTRRRKHQSGIYTGGEMILECLKRRANLIGEPITVIARKEDFLNLGGFSTSHRYWIDLDMWLRIMALGNCIFIEEPHCAFRIHGKAVSSSSQSRDFDQFDDLPGAKIYLSSIGRVRKEMRLINSKILLTIRRIIYYLYG